MLSALQEREGKNRLQCEWRHNMADETADPGAMSRCADRHLQQYADGDCSDHNRQYQTGNVVADGMFHLMVVRLANIGTGQATQRCMCIPDDQYWHTGSAHQYQWLLMINSIVALSSRPPPSPTLSDGTPTPAGCRP